MRAAVALGLLAAVAGGGGMLEHLVFFPDRRMPPAPPGVVERFFTARDGVRLHAWWMAPPGARAALLWSHGNAGNVGNRAGVFLALAARGVAVFAYDYRGYGHSDGRPDEAGVYRDAEAAYDEMRRLGIPPERIVAAGESLGGAVAIRLAVERPCAGVAVVATFTSLADVARAHYGLLGALAGTRFDSLARVPLLRVPLFAAHGDRDEIVPYALGERLAAAATPPVRLLRVRGAMHNDVLDRPELLDAIAGFAQEATR